MTYKPKDDHPWKNTYPPKVARWAKEKSEITNIQTVRVARSENLHKKDRSKLEGGQL